MSLKRKRKAPRLSRTELSRYEGLEALPPVGKEYQQGYKLVNDRLPRGRQRLQRAAGYRWGARIASFVALCAKFKPKIAMGHPGPDVALPWNAIKRYVSSL
ncbi:hypothetical protein QJQ45_027632 [Haematococcus lacustris]|nr:hypothetical protein QJQ45_027632 [Haematococcus lacustris]